MTLSLPEQFTLLPKGMAEALARWPDEVAQALGKGLAASGRVTSFQPPLLADRDAMVNLIQDILASTEVEQPLEDWKAWREGGQLSSLTVVLLVLQLMTSTFRDRNLSGVWGFMLAYSHIQDRRYPGAQEVFADKEKALHSEILFDLKEWPMATHEMLIGRLHPLEDLGSRKVSAMLPLVHGAMEGSPHHWRNGLDKHAEMSTWSWTEWRLFWLALATEMRRRRRPDLEAQWLDVLARCALA